MINVKSLNKNYGTHQVLHNIDFTIPKGNVVSLIGPNGAGKSTLLSIISRLEESDTGQISIDGKDIHKYHLHELAKKTSYLKQHNSYDLKLKIEELIAFGRFPYSQGNLTRTDYNKIDEAIEIMNLANIRNAYIDEISGGQLQRVFLAMVFAQDTDYILLDEPLNNLDMKHCLSTMQLTEQLVKEYNKTIIMVIHDINFAANYSDIIIGMKEGKIACIDKTENIIKEDVLKNLYDIDFKVIEDNKSRICNYYKP